MISLAAILSMHFIGFQNLADGIALSKRFVLVAADSNVEIIRADGKRESRSAGSIQESLSYVVVLSVGDKIDFRGTVYLWDLQSGKPYDIFVRTYQPPTDDTKLEPGWEIQQVSSGPSINPERLTQCGPDAGENQHQQKAEILVPVLGTVVRIQNVSVRLSKPAPQNASLQVRIGKGKNAVDFVATSPVVDQSGTVSGAFERRTVLENSAIALNAPSWLLKDQLVAPGISASLRVTNSGFVPVVLIDDASSELVQELDWLLERGPGIRKGGTADQKSTYYSEVIRTACLQYDLRAASRFCDVSLVAKTVRKNKNFPGWLGRALSSY